MEPNDEFVRLVRSFKRVDAQNRLMSMADREIALAVMCMEDDDRSYLLSLLSPAKSSRVCEEIELQERLAIGFKQYLKAVEHAIGKLQAPGRTSSIKSYLRPKRR